MKTGKLKSEDLTCADELIRVNKKAESLRKEYFDNNANKKRLPEYENIRIENSLHAGTPHRQRLSRMLRRMKNDNSKKAQAPFTAREIFEITTSYQHPTFKTSRTIDLLYIENYFATDRLSTSLEKLSPVRNYAELLFSHVDREEFLPYLIEYNKSNFIKIDFDFIAHQEANVANESIVKGSELHEICQQYLFRADNFLLSANIVIPFSSTDLGNKWKITGRICLLPTCTQSVNT